MSDTKALVLGKTLFHVSNVNLKPENRGKKAKVNRMDIDGYVEVPMEVLSAISRADIHGLQEYMFSDEGDPIDTGAEAIPYRVQFNDHPINFSVMESGGGNDFVSKKIHKISAEPTHSGHVKIYMQIQIYPLNANEMWALSQTSLEPHYLTIEAPPHQAHIEDDDK